MLIVCLTNGRIGFKKIKIASETIDGVRNQNCSQQSQREMKTTATHMKPPPKLSIPATLDVNSLVDR
jgi:hypothetical protein